MIEEELGRIPNEKVRGIAKQNIEDIKKYDYRTGYPEKLRF